MRAPCKIDGCDNESAGRGWCKKHWRRWRKHGDPATVLPYRAPNKRQDHCDVEGCGEPHHAHGYCSKHAAKFKRYGNPEEPDRKPTGRPLKGAQPGYDAVHRRLRRKVGPPSVFPCGECSQPAHEWAYAGGCPEELATQPGLRREYPGLHYCTHPEHYVPLCRRCHRSFDDSLKSDRNNIDGRFQ